MTTPNPGRARPFVLAAIVLVPLLACAHKAKPDKAAPAKPPEREFTSVEEMLTGRFSGVTVERGSGGGFKIRIRGGVSSFNNGEEPLIIVDEVPLPQGSNGLLFLNPYDITNIQVLKNPADVAVYGIRGANGVIKITTKPGGRRR